MKHVYVILDEMDREIVETVKSFPDIEIVQWDNSFDTAYAWLSRNPDVQVDVFLASEYTQVSTLDEKGRRVSRDTALLQRIRDIYLLKSQAKFLLFCDPDRTLPENREFLCSLVAIGIYDFRTDSTLTREKLRGYLEEPKRDISYIQEYLPGKLRGTKSNYKVRKVELVEPGPAKKENRTTIHLPNLKDIFKRLPRPKPDKHDIIETETEHEEIKHDEDRKSKAPALSGRGENIYAYGLGLNEPGVVVFSAWEQLEIAARTVPPDTVVLSVDVPELEEKIRALKVEHPGAEIVVIGVDGLLPGTNACFKEWNEEVLRRIKKPQEAVRLTRRGPLIRPGRMRTTVCVVVGAAHRVGVTSFCLALSKYLAPKHDIEILDAGGGAYNWVRHVEFPVRKMPPYSIAPGVVTIIDTGTSIPLEVQPFANLVLILTDLSRDAVDLHEYTGKASYTYLIGTRGASARALAELSDLWHIPVLGTLNEEPNLRKAEQAGRIIIPGQWKKCLSLIGGKLRSIDPT